MRAVVAVCVAFAMAGEQAQAQDKPIDELRLMKVGLDTSLQDFLKLYPNAERTKVSDDKYGVKTYAVFDPNGESWSSFSFLDGELHLMFAYWTKKGLSDAGGWEPVVNKIVKKYGKANAESPATVLKWVSPDTSNVLLIILDDQCMQIGITSKKVHARLNELKAKQAKSKIDD